jgi:Carbohydrate-selective porin, OprB family/S-layer homology domain
VVFMSNAILKSLLATPALLGVALAVGAIAPANAQSAPNAAVLGHSGAMDQVTSVSQLSDVKPTDWAFQALQSLVERYGCIAGYPDKSYRGNRAMTRYEFAAGLNACMDRVNELIGAGTADLVKKEDLETLKKMQEEFTAELATLRGRVDALEARTATLEKQQFSTTTKLRGEVIFSLAGVLGDEKATGVNGNGPDLDDNTTLSDRVRLSLNTSFTGKDLLMTRLNARNTPNLGAGATGATGTNMAKLSYEGGGGESNEFTIDKLWYQFPLSKQAKVRIDVTGAEFYNNMNNFSPYLGSDGQGAISRFGRFNPIYRPGTGGTGATFNFTLNDKVTLSAGFLARGANDPTQENGLFDGSNAAIAQIAFTPSKAFQIGATYVRSYNRGILGGINNNPVSGGTGSAFANAPFGAAATTADNFGIQASFKFNPKVALSGWVGYASAHSERTNADADIWNWAVTLAFPDLGKKGNVAAIIVGLPPKVTSNDLAAREDNDSTLHVEALYRYQLSNNISITPGLVVLFNPEHNDNNDTIFVGAIRTTFSF